MAWQLDHKNQCPELAKSRLQDLVDLMHVKYGGEGRTEGITRFAKQTIHAIEHNRQPTPSDVQSLNALKLVCKTLAGQVEHADCWYLVSLALLTQLAKASNPLDRKKADKLLKEVVSALEKHRTAALASLLSDTATFFLMLVSNSMQLLGRLGRKAEAAELGRRELPTIEALAAGARPEQPASDVAAMCLDDLAELVIAEAEDEWSQHYIRMDVRARSAWGFEEHEMAISRFIKGQAEGEALAKKALAVAEKGGCRGEEVRVIWFADW